VTAEASLGKPRRLWLERQIKPVGEIGHGAIEAAQQDDLEDLGVVIMLR